jgi:hypothetical protein
MKRMDIFRNHRHFWTKERKRSLATGIFILCLAVIVQVAAGHYSSRQAALAPAVGDILLDHLPVLPLDFIIVIVAIIFWIFSSLLLVFKPDHLLFGIKAIAFFIICRAFFMDLTHLGLYPNAASPGIHNLGWGFYHEVTFQGNLFFSAHAGFPFLMALIFWGNNGWRRFFIMASIFFGAAVLLAHVHYSIDVFAAPFMTYGIFVIATKCFPEDYALSKSKTT